MPCTEQCLIPFLSLPVELEQLLPASPSAVFLQQMNPPDLLLSKITEVLCGCVTSVLVTLQIKSVPDEDRLRPCT